ncbi:hypothetical protein WN51_01689 [Melipona quadrifasciata]|uniref:Uncharacterized protein n=1 Tax=Melipona quadrifasciata TaxID=166423 RepID=A0A0M8ZWD9_9HYME|nr:hypothetical protein WN51_01689 [Melipona quadrifasciata]
MRNKQFNNESDLKEEVSKFFRSKTKDFYKNNVCIKTLGKTRIFNFSHENMAKIFLDI